MRAALLRVAPIAAAALLAIDIVVTLAEGGNVGVAMTDGVALWSQSSTIVSSALLVALAAISVVVLVAAFKFRANASARVRRVLVVEFAGLCLAVTYAAWVQLVLVA